MNASRPHFGETNLSFSDQQPNNEPVERRRTARFPFVADAEISENASGIRVFARVSKISLTGCHLEALHGFPVGSQVFVKIFTRTDFFESAATVTYYQPSLGIGLAFRDTSRYFQPTLRRWLLEAMRTSSAPVPAETT
jgi:hypothetical protein